MWQNFDGKPYSREQFLTHLGQISPGRLGWCKFFTVHNTSSPSIAQWQSKIATPAQRIINLENYYEHSLGWHAGPHGFIPPSKDVVLYGFTNFDVPGVHASCFNSASIGLEMVGDFDSEDFNSGLGAQVRDNAIFVLAALHLKRGLRPDGYKLGVSGLHFHVDCKRDNHACPGKTVNRDALVNAILDEMERQSGAVAVAKAQLPEDSMSIEDGAVTGAAASLLGAGPAAPLVIPVADSPKEEKPGLLDRLAPNATKVNDLADQGSRIAQHLKSFKTLLWRGGGVVATTGGAAATLVDPNKGTAQVVGSWGSQHPILLAFACSVVVAVIIAGVAYYFAKKIEAGLVSAADAGRYNPRGA